MRKIFEFDGNKKAKGKTMRRKFYKALVCSVEWVKYLLRIRILGVILGIFCLGTIALPQIKKNWIYFCTRRAPLQNHIDCWFFFVLRLKNYLLIHLRSRLFAYFCIALSKFIITVSVLLYYFISTYDYFVIFHLRG